MDLSQTEKDFLNSLEEHTIILDEQEIQVYELPDRNFTPDQILNFEKYGYKRKWDGIAGLSYYTKKIKV
jgi:glucuronate isomerase